ncbi:hypothetical protein [Streptomyces sp. NPDC006551]|uniref:hypothetical protein n=1 Tax=Streptomyces sp. NPDC006551 TaxID=3157178 RepID=UPI0033B93176
MPHYPCTDARPAPYTTPYTALLLVLSVLLSLLLPAGVAWAATPTAQATVASAAQAPEAKAPAAAQAPAEDAPADDAPAAEDCPVLPLAPLGDPGDAVGKAALEGNGTACFTFTAEQPGLHRLLLDDQHNNTLARVYDGETELDCYDYDWREGWCTLPRAGAYTLKLSNGTVDPDEALVAVIPLATTAGCLPETGTSWDLEPLKAKTPSQFAIICQPFTGKAGERITVDFATTKYGDEIAWITDETGRHICVRDEDGSDGCVLPSDGPYRVLGHVRDVEDGFPAEYTLKIRRLSDPQGCAVAPVNAYGSSPTEATSPTGCRTFTAPADGTYDVYGVAAGQGERTRLKVYDPQGRTVCETWSLCELTAGVAYTLLTDRPTLILHRASAAGCEQPAALGVLDGSFAAAGEIDCVSLPVPQDATIAILTPLGGPEPRPDVVVVDAAGTTRCGDDRLLQGTCVLTGPAPYRALISTDDTLRPTGAYRALLHRTDVVSTCPAVPSGDFTATSPTARFRTGDGVFSHCLSIPADGRSTTENLQLQAAPGTVTTAQVSVLDVTGKQVCQLWPSLSSWTTCQLTPGAAHTVLVTGRNTPAEYTLARRDVTATAKGCAETPATAVGGASTGGKPGVPGSLLCHQVTTGAAGDVLHLNVRDPLGTANILAYRADGSAPTCGYRNRSCAVTGSTHYQVLVTVPPHLKAADSYRFDALRIATPSGPAPECAKVPNISHGYGPITGTLDEQHTAVCRVLPTAARDRFDVKISDTAGATDIAVPALYDASLDNNCMLVSATGYQCYLSEPGFADPSPSTFLLGLPEKASKADYSAELDCWSSLCGTETVSVASVSPSSAQSGKIATLTVQGTALSPKDKVQLLGGPASLTATTVGVSEDARTLTATVDLRSAPTGTWQVYVTAGGMQYARGTLTVTPPAAGVGTFKPITPTRLMDTRSGLGVPKAKIGPGGTVTLQATGKAGIPVSGVTAVVLNVTATNATAGSFVSVYPDGTARTSASNLNFTAGQTIPNLVVVPVVNGKVSFYNKAGTVDLLADVSGYYTSDMAGSTFKPITPTRLMDTRAGLGVAQAKVGPGGVATLQVAGVSGIPVSGVTAVVLNVTATNATSGSFVSVYPDGTARTSASNLNFTAGQTIPNLVVVPVVNGKVSFYNKAGTVDLLADVSGYFTTDGTGSLYKPITPTRLMDTRAGQGVPQAKVGPGGVATLQVAGVSGIPVSGVTAVVLNVTATNATSGSFVSVYPDGTARTSASNLNFTAGQTIPNLVVVPVVNGKVSFYNKSGSVDLLADVAGYYTS